MKRVHWKIEGETKDDAVDRLIQKEKNTQAILAKLIAEAKASSSQLSAKLLDLYIERMYESSLEETSLRYSKMGVKTTSYRI